MRQTLIFVRLKHDDGHCDYCGLGKGEQQFRTFKDMRHAKLQWNNVIFKKVSSVRREFYEKTFVAIYEPRIVTLEITPNFDRNIVIWDGISNPYFSFEVARFFPHFAEKLWNAGEPVVYDFKPVKLKI